MFIKIENVFHFNTNRETISSPKTKRYKKNTVVANDN